MQIESKNFSTLAVATDDLPSFGDLLLSGLVAVARTTFVLAAKNVDPGPLALLVVRTVATNTAFGPIAENQQSQARGVALFAKGSNSATCERFLPRLDSLDEGGECVKCIEGIHHIDVSGQPDDRGWLDELETQRRVTTAWGHCKVWIIYDFESWISPQSGNAKARRATLEWIGSLNKLGIAVLLFSSHSAWRLVDQGIAGVALATCNDPVKTCSVIIEEK